MKANNWPLSSLGKKPFGMRMNSATVAMTMIRNTTMTMRPWSIDQMRVRS